MMEAAAALVPAAPRPDEVTMTASPYPELVRQSAAQLAKLVRSGDVTPVEVVRAHLERIASLDPELRAFQLVRAAAAVTEAAAVGARKDLQTLPLAGVPVAIKDNVPVGGQPMRLGSLATPDVPREADHVVVRRLREAGAVVLGATRVPELCVWPTTDGAFGVARNPWNPERTPGGSSGGSAAAVAAAMVPLALGADGLGSIRIPSAACGVVGLKPGAGVVPADLGESAWYGMAENGPIATTVEDAALMLSVLAGRNEFRDPAPPRRALRIAVSTRPPIAGVRIVPAIAAATIEAGRLLQGAGHTTEQLDPPAAPLGCVVGIFAHWFAGTAQDARLLDSRKLERRTRTHVRLGRVAQRLRLVRREDRETWRRLMSAFFERFDLLITPVLATNPISAEPWSQRSWIANAYAAARFAPFTAAWNFAACPAAAVPAGLLASGMPTSIQLIAPAGGEQLILSVAKQLESMRPWTRHAR